MDIENQEFIFCEDGEYRVYCNICDNFWIERFYKNHLKSQTHTNNCYKRKHSKHLKKSCITKYVLPL